MADVESLELQITGDARSAEQSINSLISTLERLNNATAGGCGLGAVANGMKNIGSASSGASSANTKSGASFGKLAAKVAIAHRALSKVGGVIASWMNESNEYTENMNLFSVSMGEYAKSAAEYATKVGEVMGIDPSDWMRSQGVFMTLATGFGVAGDRAATMSQQLTQLGYDLSSFYNISVEEAMQKVKSGFAGELEPLRNLGYDLSQAKLQAIALSLGIDKTVASMTQAEKAELRYYAVMTQVTQVQGDMARTLQDPANQLRILQAQVTQAARAFGNLFIPVLNAVLPVVTAVVKVITMLAQAIASLFGINLEVDFSKASSSAGDLGASVAETSDGLGGAADNAKKLRKVLLGIDELNVMTDPASGGGGGGGAGGGDGFDFELPTYNFIDEATNQKINEITEKIKEWLGLNKEINSLSDLLHTRLGAILITVGLIGLGFASWKIATAISSIGSLVKILEKIKALAPVAKLASSIFLTIAGAVTLAVSAIDAFKNGIDWGNLLGMLGGMGLIVGGLAISFGSVGAAIGLLVGGITVLVAGIADAVNGSKSLETALAIIGGFVAIGGAIAILIGSWIPLLVAGIAAAVAMVVMYWDEIVAWVSNAVTVIGQFFSDLWAGIVVVWNDVATWFDATVIKPIVKFFTGLWNDISTLASDCWEAIVDFFTPAINWFSQLFGSVFQTLSDIFYNIGVIASGCWAIIQAAWGVASTWFNTKIITPVKNFFTNLWNGIQTAAINAWNGIKSVYTTISNWINTTIIQPVSSFFSNLWTGFINGAKNAWAGVKTVFGTVASFFRDTFQKAWAGIVKVFSVAGEIFVDIKNGIVTAFKSVVNGLIRGINRVVSIPFNAINSALSTIRNISILGLTPFSGLRSISVPSIPYLAGGGILDAGQLFVAREAGPELVANAGRKTAVMNNDQIVESVSQGVYRAFIQAMAESGNNQVVEAKVNDKVLFEVIVGRNRQETMRTGRSPLLGGA
jgi:hypothetical protein